MFTRRSRAVILASFLAAALAISSAPIAHASNWVLTDESVNLGLSGVSPHVERVAGGDRVWRADMVPTGSAVALCNDAGVCTPEAFAT